jgi:threonine aldolase
MILAMMDAPLGDDVYGEDPTVARLEELASTLLEKEAAVFVPSGTMGNLISVGVHCARGSEVILGTESHIFRYEGAGASAFLGVGFHTVPNAADGTLPLDLVRAAFRPDDAHYPRSALLALENTQNRCVGAPLSVDYMRAARALCDELGLRLHVDGARLFNAATALNVNAAELVRGADSVSVCLSKGLGAPVGSVVVGSKAFIAQARRLRKALGGGMRQAGVIAACGVVALEKNVAKLASDHQRAKLLAASLARIDGLSVPVERVKTNIIYFDITDPAVSADALRAELAEKHNVLIGAYGDKRCRAVTHLQFFDRDIDPTVDAFQAAMKNLRKA